MSLIFFHLLDIFPFICTICIRRSVNRLWAVSVAETSVTVMRWRGISTYNPLVTNLFRTHFPAEVLQMLCYRSKSSGSPASKAAGSWWQSSISIRRPFSPSTHPPGFSPLSQLEPMAFSYGCDQRPRWAEDQREVKDLLMSCERQPMGGRESHQKRAWVVCVFVCVLGQTLTASQNRTGPAELQSSDTWSHTETLLTYASVHMHTLVVMSWWVSGCLLAYSIGSILVCF